MFLLRPNMLQYFLKNSKKQPVIRHFGDPLFNCLTEKGAIAEYFSSAGLLQ